MTGREKFLKTYYFSVYMSGEIQAFLLIPTTPNYKSDVERAQYRRFVQGAAGITSMLMSSGDAEIKNGIRLLQKDLRAGFRYGACPDPQLYYHKQKAIAAICRPYFYSASDDDIVSHILALKANKTSFRDYPELPDHFVAELLHYWLLDALTTCDYYPDSIGSRELTCAEWVEHSFLTPELRENWERLAKLKPGPQAESFLADSTPFATFSDQDIADTLKRETDYYAAYQDKEPYETLFYYGDS